MKPFTMSRRDVVQRGAIAAALGVVGDARSARARHRHVPEGIFVSSKEVPLLQLPEGLTASENHVFVGTYNYVYSVYARTRKTEALNFSISAALSDSDFRVLA